MTDRLDSIARCMEELARIRRERQPGEWGAAIGEMDQIRELHRLLHDHQPIDK